MPVDVCIPKWKWRKHTTGYAPFDEYEYITGDYLAIVFGDRGDIVCDIYRNTERFKYNDPRWDVLVDGDSDEYMEPGTLAAAQGGFPDFECAMVAAEHYIMTH